MTPGKNGAPQQITFESAARIVCYGMSPAILAAIPLAGAFISAICVLIVTVVGAREVYRISTGRAIVVALFPKILLFGIIFLGFVAVVIMILKAFGSFF